MAHLGIGIAKEGSSILDAVKQAIESPLLDTSIKGAGTMMLNTSGRVNLIELKEAVSYIKSIVGTESNIIWGTVTDAKQVEESTVVVTLIATGIGEIEAPAEVTEPAKRPEPIKMITPIKAFNPNGLSGNNADRTDAKDLTLLKRNRDVKNNLEIPGFLRNYSNRK